MQITVRPVRGRTAVFENDQLFSAGLLLSAVVAFCLPFTYFIICQTESRGPAAPSVGGSRELHVGSAAVQLMVLLNGDYFSSPPFRVCSLTGDGCSVIDISEVEWIVYRHLRG